MGVVVSISLGKKSNFFVRGFSFVAQYEYMAFTLQRHSCTSIETSTDGVTSALALAPNILAAPELTRHVMVMQMVYTSIGSAYR